MRKKYVKQLRRRLEEAPGTAIDVVVAIAETLWPKADELPDEPWTPETFDAVGRVFHDENLSPHTIND